MQAACKGADMVFIAGDAKLISVFEMLEQMDVPVTQIFNRKTAASVVPPPPLIALAETYRSGRRWRVLPSRQGSGVTSARRGGSGKVDL
jgi:hypothetical protein